MSSAYVQQQYNHSAMYGGGGMMGSVGAGGMMDTSSYNHYNSGMSAMGMVGTGLCYGYGTDSGSSEGYHSPGPVSSPESYYNNTSPAEYSPSSPYTNYGYCSGGSGSGIQTTHGNNTSASSTSTQNVSCEPYYSYTSNNFKTACPTVPRYTTRSEKKAHSRSKFKLYSDLLPHQLLRNDPLLSHINFRSPVATTIPTQYRWLEIDPVLRTAPAAPYLPLHPNPADSRWG
uniref:Uncharacterized protein n=1 Tax=Anopheles stephensi TaxID=30069 RepID=A0A182YRS5_ANOST